MLYAIALTILSGMLHASTRVWRVSGTAALLTGTPVVGVYALVLAVGLTGALSPMAAVALGIGSNIFIAIRMLNWRVQGRKPETEPLLWGVATVLLGVLGVRLGMGQVPPTAAFAVAATICSLYAALIARDIRADIAALRRREGAPRGPEPVPASGGVTEHSG